MESICNFHTHTKLCRHAEGVPVDYVEQAVKDGCTALGFTDHCPYPDSCYDYWTHIRMSEEEVPLYHQWIETAREAAPFPVYEGFECEWDSNIASWYTEELRGKHGAQFLVLGPHWVTDGSSHVYVRDFENHSQLNKYIDQLVEGMASGAFNFLAHPDLFFACPLFAEWTEQTKACSRAIIDAASDLNIPLEINGLGMSRPLVDTSHGMRYAYPRLEFWEMAAQSEVQIICNSDAHFPKDVIFNAWRARDFAGRFGFKPVETLPGL